MNRKIAAILAGLALSGTAVAQEMEQMEPREQQEMQQRMGEQKEISGRVLGTHRETLFLEGENGVAIPVRVSHQTNIEGKRIRRGERVESHLRREFPPGEEVRASFSLVRTREGRLENVATELQKK